MLFDFVRAAFAGPRTACTYLSRRLRDGVFSLSCLCPPVSGPDSGCIADGGNLKDSVSWPKGFQEKE